MSTSNKTFTISWAENDKGGYTLKSPWGDVEGDSAQSCYDQLADFFEMCPGESLNALLDDMTPASADNK